MAQLNHIFSQGQSQTLTAALNRIIPVEGDMPGAGDLGVARFIEAAAAVSPAKTRLFTQGLATIEVTSTRLTGKAFAAATGPEQDQTLESMESSQPAFFDELVRQAYNGYYTDPRVFEALGYSTPQPEIGGQPELMDESLLEKQRQRAPFWTKV
ncbi:MAG: gluconate 2-dehydrogenase subunit 3 family protein [Chloroflexi bacterium]|nr:gluconate 2-dehydrogenase subunit 3 family protein [Chloroflexota bacterium]